MINSLEDAIVFIVFLALVILVIGGIFGIGYALVTYESSEGVELQPLCDYTHNIGVWHYDDGIIRMTPAEYEKECSQ